MGYDDKNQKKTDKKKERKWEKEHGLNFDDDLYSLPKYSWLKDDDC